MSLKQKQLIISLSVLLFVALNTTLAERSIPIQEVEAAFAKTIPPHPRLLLSDTEVGIIKNKIKTEPAWEGFYQALIAKADDIVPQSTVTRKQTGRRLLGVSRRCLDRVLVLSMAYKLSGKAVYCRRAEAEMLAAASFSDWNPSHFLDVAEMTAALAFGYDWLYQNLSAAGRGTIKEAILQKGLQPSYKVTHWVKGNNNWNQVCNGGITLGALALWEDEPALALKTVHRAVNGIQVAMAEYEPDGAYPEGPGYWIYGTSFNCLFLGALDSALNTDFGLSQMSGFSQSAAYYLHVAGPTGLYFNYPDSGSRGSFSPTVFWFARKFEQPELAWTQQQRWQQLLADKPADLLRSRLAPLVLLWAAEGVETPQDLTWRGRGCNPVAMFRSSWTDPQATYLAIKGGSPSVNHGHMDVGAFVIDAGGLRWASDLGPESYHKIESRGMKLWGRSQDAERWTIFRYNNTSHNTLVVNGQHQRVKGHASLVRFCDQEASPHVVIDLSEVYEGQLKQALRGGTLLPQGQVLLQDEVTASKSKATVRWAMVTPADVEEVTERHVLLKREGKTMHLRLHGDIKAQWTTYSTEPKADYDAPNPGTRLVGFTYDLKPGQTARYAVTLSHDRDIPLAAQTLIPLLSWSEPER